ncbi:MAG: ATP-dependent metallopeptidase FtsH/Yme1/Tma family protein [Candidatus Eisenbacteria bacterium]|nr:ATP-dependent metallopeptidase FtsH/Yme1/Tma family protein [Candidatus Eisenbacteria bacterium]
MNANKRALNKSATKKQSGASRTGLTRDEARKMAKSLASLVVQSKPGQKDLPQIQRRQLEKLIGESIAQNMMDLSQLHNPVKALAEYLGRMYSRLQIGQKKGTFGLHAEPEMKKMASSFSKKFFSEFMKRAYEIATTVSVDVPESDLRQERTLGDGVVSEQKTSSPKFTLKKFRPSLRFKDVGGNIDAKRELMRFVAFFRTPSRFREIGARLPKGVLLKGPHGAGKPSLAIAMAGEAGVPMLKIDATDLVAMYGELGSEGMAQAIAALKENSPLVILVDEVLPAPAAGQDYATFALRALFEGFAGADDVLIIGATSNPEAPDPSLLRHERFGRVLPIDKPDFKARLEIFRIYTTTSRKVLAQNPRKKLIERTLDLDRWARDTAGFTPEKIENLLNDAAILAVAARCRCGIDGDKMREAFDRIVEGAGSTHRLTDKEKEIVAVHELGHALVSQFLPNASPVAKISIVGKGEQLGYTRPYQREGRYLMSKDMLLDGIATLIGGRVAEELMYPENEKTDGASSDLQVLRDLLDYAVTEIGFGNGYVLPDKEHDREALRRQIDFMVLEAEKRALDVLTSHYYELFKLKDILVKREALTGKEFRELLRSIQNRKKKLSARQLEREIAGLEETHARMLSKVVTKAAFLPTQERYRN